MSDPVLPLGGATFSGLVELAEYGPGGMITLRGDQSSDVMAKALADVAGLALPDTRGMTVSGDMSLLWMSPDELMLLLPRDAAPTVAQALADALAGSHALVVDVSDARAQFRLTGAQARDVLAKLTPVDLAPEAMPVGHVRRSRLGQVAAGFWFVDETTVQVFCFRSVAEYMFNLLKTAADPDSAVGYLA